MDSETYAACGEEAWDAAFWFAEVCSEWSREQLEVAYKKYCHMGHASEIIADIEAPQAGLDPKSCKHKEDVKAAANVDVFDQLRSRAFMEKTGGARRCKKRKYHEL